MPDGTWKTYLHPSKDAELVRRSTIPSSIVNKLMSEIELQPEFEAWLEEHDPDYRIVERYPVLVLVFGSENAAMVFRLKTNSTIEYSE